MSEQMCYIYTYTMDIILFSLKKGMSWGRGNRELLMGREFQFGKMERVLRMDAGDGSTIE